MFGYHDWSPPKCTFVTMMIAMIVTLLTLSGTLPLADPGFVSSRAFAREQPPTSETKAAPAAAPAPAPNPKPIAKPGDAPEVARLRPEEWVRRLGARRYETREEAMAALRKIGKPAVPALLAAKDSRDLEIRTRISTLLAEIQIADISTPTLVKLNYQNAAIGDIAEDLSKSSRTTVRLSAGINHNRQITLLSEQPVTFWEALDRFCIAAGIREQESRPLEEGLGVDLFPGVQVQTMDQGLVLIPGVPTARPTLYQGLFRVRIVPNANGVRNQQPMLFENGRNRRQRFFDPFRRIENPSGLFLEISAEPGVQLAQSGHFALQTVTDQDGKNLIDEDAMEEANPQDPQMVMLQQMRGLRAMPPESQQMYRIMVPLPLEGDVAHLSERAIKQFKGEVPVQISRRLEKPFVVPLKPDAKPETFETEEVAITLHRVEAAPGQTTVEITIKAKQPGAALGLGMGMGMLGPGMVNFAPNGGNEILVLADANGNRPAIVNTSGRTVGVQEVNWTWTVRPSPFSGPPVKLMYYGQTRSTQKVTFDFLNIKFPKIVEER